MTIVVIPLYLYFLCVLLQYFMFKLETFHALEDYFWTVRLLETSFCLLQKINTFLKHETQLNDL